MVERRDYTNNVAGSLVFAHQVRAWSPILPVAVNPSTTKFSRSNPNHLSEVPGGFGEAGITEAVVRDFVIPGIDGRFDAAISSGQVLAKRT